MRLYILIIFLLLITAQTLQAQTQYQTSGWLMFLNNTKISKKWGAYMDVQLRSSDQWEYLRHVLIRPGITYYANAKNEYTLGYLFTNTFPHLEGAGDHTVTEHRIWEQYVYKHMFKNASVMHRFRLEQRFIERHGRDELFAQRLRYFVRFIIPIEKEVVKFEKGVFIALQNETFFNVQHQNELNHKLFDQNRAYGAIGFRFSKHLDIEAGYMNQAIKGLTNGTSNNILQVACYTKF